MSIEISRNGSISNSSLNETGFCTACERKSLFKCDRCGDFYCSTECQLKDWPSHRFICFPMPKLVKAGHQSADLPKLAKKDNNKAKDCNSQKGAKSLKNVCELPNESCVHLTAFKSSNRCFIHSTNPSIISEREKILNEINDLGKAASAFTSKEKRNSVLALRNEKWCRAQILKSKDKIYTIAFMDFGDKIDVSQEKLRKCGSSVDNLPCHIHLVHLNDVHFSTNQKILNSLTQFTKKEYKIKYDKTNQTEGNVELLDWRSSVSLNSTINELISKCDDVNNKCTSSSSNAEVPKTHLCESKGFEIYENNNASSKGKVSNRHEEMPSHLASQVRNPTDNSLVAKVQNKKVSPVPRCIQMQKPCLIPPFDTLTMEESDKGSQIMIMDNSFLESGYIGCLLEKYYPNLKAVTEFLNTYDAGDKPYKPQCGEYCLAKFDNMWYRAKVEAVISEDKFLVVYIDFTNENEVSSDLIRRYPLSLDYACCTTLCGIDGLPEDLSKNTLEYLENNELKPFTILKIDSIRMEANVCYFKSNALLEKLSHLQLM